MIIRLDKEQWLFRWRISAFFEIPMRPLLVPVFRQSVAVSAEQVYMKGPGAKFVPSDAGHHGLGHSDN